MWGPFTVTEVKPAPPCWQTPFEMRVEGLPLPHPETHFVTLADVRARGLRTLDVLAGAKAPARRPRIPTNPWKELGKEYQKFLEEIGG